MFFSATSGRLTVNRVPVPGVLWTEIHPPSRVTRSFMMVNPRPVPSRSNSFGIRRAVELFKEMYHRLFRNANSSVFHRDSCILPDL